MRLAKCNSMLHADVVLAYLAMIVEESERTDDITIRAWANCREQGYHLSNGSFRDQKCALVAEVRNSDSVLVMYGNMKDFDFQTHAPSDAVYEARRTFSYGSELLAAQFLLEWLGKPDEVQVCAVCGHAGRLVRRDNRAPLTCDDIFECDARIAAKEEV